MAYAYILQDLSAKQIDDANPKDYLTFCCLENKEVKKNDEYMPKEEPKEHFDYKRAQENMHFICMPI